MVKFRVVAKHNPKDCIKEYEDLYDSYEKAFEEYENLRKQGFFVSLDQMYEHADGELSFEVNVECNY